MRSTTASSSSSDLTWAAARATAPGSAVNGAASQGAAAAAWPGVAGEAAGEAVWDGRAAPAPDGRARPKKADRTRRDFRVLLSLGDIASPGGEGAPGAGRGNRSDFIMPFGRPESQARCRIGPAFPRKCHCTAIRFAGDEMTASSLSRGIALAVVLAVPPAGATPGTPPPSPPTRLAAVVLTPTEVKLTWGARAVADTEVRVELRALDGAFEDVGAVPGAYRAALVQGLQPATAYVFRVRAARGGAFSA